MKDLMSVSNRLSQFNRILLVDDDQKILEIYEYILGEFGFKGVYSKASSVNMAKDLVSENNFDLILCDRFLDDGRGDDIVKVARQKNNGLPIIMVSGDDRVESMIKCTNLGAIDYLVKPFKVDELYNKLFLTLVREEEKPGLLK